MFVIGLKKWKSLSTSREGIKVICPFCETRVKKTFIAPIVTMDLTTGEQENVEMCRDCIVTIKVIEEEVLNELENAI